MYVLIQSENKASRSINSVVPNSAQAGGTQPCSIQQVAATITPNVISTPNQGCPNNFQPAASAAACLAPPRRAQVRLWANHHRPLRGTAGAPE
jgi:hypothetical protein